MGDTGVGEKEPGQFRCGQLYIRCDSCDHGCDAGRFRNALQPTFGVEENRSEVRDSEAVGFGNPGKRCDALWAVGNLADRAADCVDGGTPGN